MLLLSRPAPTVPLRSSSKLESVAKSVPVPSARSHSSTLWRSLSFVASFGSITRYLQSAPQRGKQRFLGGPLVGRRETRLESAKVRTGISNAARAQFLVLKPREVVRLLGIALLSLLQVGKHIARHLPRIARHARPSGPAGLVLVLVGLIGAGIATVRQKIMNNVRSCKSCSGYGIQRCMLCGGKGMVGWEGKWSHREPCPMCLGRRFVDCTICGGKFHRPLFQHIQTTAATLLEEIKEAEALTSRTVLTD